MPYKLKAYMRGKEGTQRTNSHSSVPGISGFYCKVGDRAEVFRRSRKLAFLKLRPLSLLH